MNFQTVFYASQLFYTPTLGLLVLSTVGNSDLGGFGSGMLAAKSTRTVLKQFKSKHRTHSLAKLAGSNKRMNTAQ